MGKRIVSQAFLTCCLLLLAIRSSVNADSSYVSTTTPPPVKTTPAPTVPPPPPTPPNNYKVGLKGPKSSKYPSKPAIYPSNPPKYPVAKPLYNSYVYSNKPRPPYSKQPAAYKGSSNYQSNYAKPYVPSYYGSSITSAGYPTNGYAKPSKYPSRVGYSGNGYVGNNYRYSPTANRFSSNDRPSSSYDSGYQSQSNNNYNQQPSNSYENKGSKQYYDETGYQKPAIYRPRPTYEGGSNFYGYEGSKDTYGQANNNEYSDYGITKYNPGQSSYNVANSYPSNQVSSDDYGGGNYYGTGDYYLPGDYSNPRGSYEPLEAQKYDNKDYPYGDDAYQSQSANYDDSNYPNSMPYPSQETYQDSANSYGPSTRDRYGPYNAQSNNYPGSNSYVPPSYSSDYQSKYPPKQGDYYSSPAKKEYPAYSNPSPNYNDYPAGPDYAQQPSQDANYRS